MLILYCFFKQKTAYEVRISDGSSDVCSSDLPALFLVTEEAAQLAQSFLAPQRQVHEAPLAGWCVDAAGEGGELAAQPLGESARGLAPVAPLGAAAGLRQPPRDVALVERGEEEQHAGGEARADLEIGRAHV